MTVENEVPENRFIANEDTEFFIDFFIVDTANITIRLNTVTVNPLDYYIELEDLEDIDSNGTRVVFYEPVTGELVITRTTILEYITLYNNTLGNINASNLNGDFSRIYRILQEQDTTLRNLDSGNDLTDYYTILLNNINNYKEKL